MVALLLAGAISLVFTLLTTPLFIRLFRRLEWGQFIRDDGPKAHHTKRGTPTMGGVVIILGAVLGYFAGHLLNAPEEMTPSGLLVIFMMVGLGLGILYSAQAFATQASASNADLPFSAGMYAFFRSLGQCVGVAVGGVTFQNAFKHEIEKSA